MAAHHHHLRRHPAAVSYCYCCPPYSPCHHHPPPPPPPPPDCHHPLYHPPPHPHLYSAQTLLPESNQYHPHLREHYFREERETQHTIASLLRRIAALESALRGCSSSSSYSLRDAAARTIQTHFRAFLLRRSRTLRQLKDLASIKSDLSILKSSISKQIHFDYDVIYHHAMELALKLDAIQGGDPMIRDGKSSVRRDLNKFLDFIDGFYLEMRGLSSGVNGRHERSNVKTRVPNGEKRMGNVKSGGLKSGTMEKLRGLVERIDKLGEELNEEENEVVESPDVFMSKRGVYVNKNGGSVKKLCGVQPKVKKSVSFADDGKVYRVLKRNSEPILDENDDESVDRVDLVSRESEDDLGREVDEMGVASKEEDGGGGGDDDDDDDDGDCGGDNDDDDGDENGSDGEKNWRSYQRSGSNFQTKMYNQGGVDNIAFAAPLPLKMETRADLVDKRKKLADNL